MYSYLAKWLKKVAKEDLRLQAKRQGQKYLKKAEKPKENIVVLKILYSPSFLLPILLSTYNIDKQLEHSTIKAIAEDRKTSTLGLVFKNKQGLFICEMNELTSL